MTSAGRSQETDSHINLSVMKTALGCVAKSSRVLKSGTSAQHEEPPLKIHYETTRLSE